jgi:mannose-1-phosphate guanylyltransferase
VITQAFVLGAGLGTRLKALTQTRPKPLIPVANRPLITYAFDHLLGGGVTRFIVNTHWRAEAYAEAFPEAVYRGASINFLHEAPEVLETGGGIKNAEALLNGGPFWVYNGDILSTLPLEPAWRNHHDSRNEVTMVLRSKDGPLQVSFDERHGRVIDLGRRVVPEREPEFLFTGIYVVEPEFFQRIPAATKISVVPIFSEMIRAGARLGGVVIDDGTWFDLGTREQYLAVHRCLEGSPWIHPEAQVAPDAIVTGTSAIGRGAKIAAGAHLHDTLVWDDGQVTAGAQLDRCIVVSGGRAAGTLLDRDITPE